jgi:hypothetical protein
MRRRLVYVISFETVAMMGPVEIGALLRPSLIVVADAVGALQTVLLRNLKYA